MYKAKILEIGKNTHKVDIPSLGIVIQAYYLFQGEYSYSVGDLVIVSKLNTDEYIILGQVKYNNWGDNI